MIIKIIKNILLTTLAIPLSGFADTETNDYGKDLDYLSLTLEELGKIKVSIATGNNTTIREAPAIASVITATDIEAMGLQNLDQVLQTVPGLHVSVSPIAYTPIYTFRGIRGGLFNPQILMLINGIPITRIFNGDRGIISDGYPIENISRIEIIRGPGSALYGADAYAGVINIVTKTAQDINGQESGIRAGSFNSYDTWLLSGKQFNSYSVSGYLSAGTTDGQDGVIQADSQTINDEAFGTNASEAPNSVNTGYDAFDAHFDISSIEWQFRTGINYRDNIGTGAGVAQALDPNGKGEGLRWTADITYHPNLETNNWKPEFKLSTMYYHEKSEVTIFPPGTDFSLAGGGNFPNGMIGNPEQKERHYRISLSTDYYGFKNHQVRIGSGYSIADLYDVKENRNYRFVPGSVFPVADSAFNNDLFITPRKRKLSYIYLQDEWSLNPRLYLTTGIRYDDYSDFGDTTNPRIALVWNTSDTVTTKVLYGQAFRAPAFTELYNQDNPVVTGNNELDPERITSTEAAISWQPAPNLSLGANIFRYEMKDIIRYQPNTDPTTGSTADNVGEQTGEGLELEFGWDPLRNLRIQGNYAHQKSIDEISGEDAGLAPENMIHLRSDWRFSQNWAANAQINWIADRRREPDDNRKEIDDYQLVNISLRTTSTKNWELSMSILNLFNDDAREPSSGGGTILIPNDLPLSERSFYLKITYQF